MPHERPAVSVDSIVIDGTRCAGHARCMADAPAVFGNDDVSGLAYVLPGADVATDQAAVTRAIEGCPELAIAWAPTTSS
jgi:ferredoxin